MVGNPWPGFNLKDRHVVALNEENSEMMTLDCASASDLWKIATGQANKDAPHLIVPFYMPLAQSMTLAEGLQCCRPDIREQVSAGKVRLLALAHGQMVEQGEEPRMVQFVLLHGTFADEEPDGYYVFDTTEDEIDIAVLMNGDGTRFLNERPLSQEEAVGLWMGGFLGWNEKCPGLYRLRYALIEAQPTVPDGSHWHGC